MGGMLKRTELAKGTRNQLKGNPAFGGNLRVPPKKAPTLSDSGLTKKESSKAQFLASLPDETFEEVTSEKKQWHGNSINGCRQYIF